jgi:hypothetical protein
MKFVKRFGSIIMKNHLRILLLPLLLMLWSGLSFAQATQLFDGDFESGTFQGWIPGGDNGGFALVAAKGSCYSGNDTTAISFNGNPTSNYAALLRSNAAGDVDSIARVRSQSFVAGNGIIFSALSETLDPDPGHNPVSLAVNIINSSGSVISEQPYRTAIVQLAQGSPSIKRDGAFSTHFVDTHHLAGQEISIEFTQHTNHNSRGYFSLIDNVLFLESGQFVLSTSQPIAVAGTGLTTSGTFFMDPRASIDPDDSPYDLNYSWFINGEDSVRDIDLPCVNLNEDFLLSAGNNTATLYANDGFHYAADTIRFVIPESTEDSTGNDDDSTSDSSSTTESDTDSTTDDNSGSSGDVTLTDPADECDVDLEEQVATPDPDDPDDPDNPDNPDNSPPVIDLNQPDGETLVVDFVVGEDPVNVADNVTITDADDDDIVSVTISIQNPSNGDSLSAPNFSGLVAIGSGTTSITLALADRDSPVSNEDFETAIEAIEFEYIVPSGGTVESGDRTITYAANDGIDTGDSIDSIVDVAGSSS